MATAAAAASKPSVTPSTSILVRLPPDVLREVSQFAPNPSVGICSKQLRHIAQYQEHLQWRANQANPLIQGKIKGPWTDTTKEQRIAEIRQIKREMIAWIRNHTTLVDSLELKEINVLRETATLDELCRFHEAISKNKDKYLVWFFNGLEILNETAFSLAETYSKFRATLAGLSDMEKATRIREWMKKPGEDQHFTLSDAALEGCIRRPDGIPVEILDIPMSPGILNEVFTSSAMRGNFELVKKVIESESFHLISNQSLILAFNTGAFGGSNFHEGILSLLIQSIEARGFSEQEISACNFRYRAYTNTPRISARKRLITNRVPVEWFVKYLSQRDPSVKTVGCAQIIEDLSPSRFEQLFSLVCEKLDKPGCRLFLKVLLSHPRCRELKTSTIARGLFAATGGEMIARTAAAAGTYYLGTHLDALPGPVASLSTASLGTAAVAGLTTQKVKSAAKSMWTTITSPRAMKEKTILILKLVAELGRRQLNPN